VGRTGAPAKCIPLARSYEMKPNILVKEKTDFFVSPARHQTVQTAVSSSFPAVQRAVGRPTTRGAGS